MAPSPPEFLWDLQDPKDSFNHLTSVYLLVQPLPSVPVMCGPITPCIMTLGHCCPLEVLESIAVEFDIVSPDSCLLGRALAFSIRVIHESRIIILSAISVAIDASRTIAWMKLFFFFFSACDCTSSFILHAWCMFSYVSGHALEYSLGMV